MGKKIGIIAMICTVIYIIFSIIAIIEAPEIPEDIYELMGKDQEAVDERWQEIEDNASGLYKAANTITTITGLAGIVLAIISIVKLVKAKEKGKVIPILCIVLIIVFFFVTGFASVDMGAAFQAGYESQMKTQE